MKKFLKEVPRLLRKSDIVLVKHQAVDFDHSRHIRLKAILPNITHRIIVLNVPAYELKKRLAQKPWWDDKTNTDDYIKMRTTRTENFLRQLKDDFTISFIDSSNNGAYKIIEVS